jgi:hypothetical protein
LIAGRAVVFNEYESACDSPPTKKKKRGKTRTRKEPVDTFIRIYIKSMYQFGG